MQKQDIPFLSATELSARIKSKEVSPVEATEAYLERVDRLNPTFHAYLTVCADEAMAAARESEEALAGGQYRGPMHGIPVTVKDQVKSKGIRTTCGSPIFSDNVPEEDGTVLANLKNAGAILLGKANMTEFGTTGISHAFEFPRNPWNLERHTGGSSSGSGAATAAFMCATSLGEDTGGSVRSPATWCGLVGLRPSYGRVSRYGVIPGVWSMDAIGPISRTVQDCAMTLGAIAGHDLKDGYTWDVPVPDYQSALTGEIRGLRLGVITEQMESDLVDPEVRDSVTAAISKLVDLGATVQDVSIPLSVHQGTISGGLRVEAPTNHRELILNRLQDIRHDNRIGYLVGSILPAQAYYKTHKLRTLLRRQVLDALEKVDVLVMPTSGEAAQMIVPDPPITEKKEPSRIGRLLTPLFSLANVTALSVPCGFTSDDLPIGLQLAAKPFEEATVLNTAYAYEQATAWHTRRPPNV